MIAKIWHCRGCRNLSCRDGKRGRGRNRRIKGEARYCGLGRGVTDENVDCLEGADVWAQL
jgi:hypothetical protein